MLNTEVLTDILERVASDSASEDDRLALREALLEGEITLTRSEGDVALANGHSNVVFGGSAHGAFVITGGVTMQIAAAGAEYDRLRDLVREIIAAEPSVDWQKKTLSAGRFLAPLLAAIAMSLVVDVARRFVGLDGSLEEMAGTTVLGFLVTLTAFAGALTLLSFLLPELPFVARLGGLSVFGDRFRSKKAIALTGIALAITIGLRLSLPLLAHLYNERGVQFQYGEQPNHLGARESYQRAGRLNPSGALAHYYLGTVYEESERQKAIEEYLLAIKYDRQLLPARNSLAHLYNRIGYEYHEKGDPSQALEWYQKAVSLKPDYAQAHYNLANACEDLQQHERAIEEYLLAIKYNSRLYPAYNNLARLYLLSGDKEAAGRALNLLVDARDLSPQDESPQDESVQYSLYKNLGWANFILEKYGQAELDLRRAISLRADNGSAHCLLAYVLKRLGKTRESFAECYDCVSFSKNEQDIEEKWVSDAKERLMRGVNK